LINCANDIIFILFFDLKLDFEAAQKHFEKNKNAQKR